VLKEKSQGNRLKVFENSWFGWGRRLHFLRSSCNRGRRKHLVSKALLKQPPCVLQDGYWSGCDDNSWEYLSFTATISYSDQLWVFIIHCNHLLLWSNKVTLCSAQQIQPSLPMATLWEKSRKVKRPETKNYSLWLEPGNRITHTCWED